MTLHVETYGPAGAEPILAVHGITAFGARFRRLAERLPKRRWICPDLRGHGQSPSAPPWATEDHVADLLAVLEDQGVDRFDLVGHSFGGHVAIHLASTVPDRVGRIVLLDPASVIDPAHAEHGAMSYARDPGWATREEAEAEIATWFVNEDAQPDLPLEIERNLTQDDEGRWRMRFSPLVIVAAYSEMCRPLPPLPDRDVLLVEADPAHSSVNDALRAGLAAQLGDRLGRAVVPDATHVLFRDQLVATAAAVAPFLSA
jgi:lipase